MSDDENILSPEEQQRALGLLDLANDWLDDPDAWSVRERIERFLYDHPLNSENTASDKPKELCGATFSYHMAGPSSVCRRIAGHDKYHSISEDI